MAATVRAGRIILFLMLFPIVVFFTPAWLWVMREVLTFGKQQLELRREFWLIGSTSIFDRQRIRNLRVDVVNLKGYRHAIVFDHDPAVITDFGKDLDETEAHMVVSAITRWLNGN